MVLRQDGQNKYRVILAIQSVRKTRSNWKMGLAWEEAGLEPNIMEKANRQPLAHVIIGFIGSGKTTFLEDEINLDITGFDWRTRREEVEDTAFIPDRSQAIQAVKTSL